MTTAKSSHPVALAPRFRVVARHEGGPSEFRYRLRGSIPGSESATSVMQAPTLTGPGLSVPEGPLGGCPRSSYADLLIATATRSCVAVRLEDLEKKHTADHETAASTSGLCDRG